MLRTNWLQGLWQSFRTNSPQRSELREPMKAARPSPQRRLSFEALEGRRLVTATPLEHHEHAPPTTDPVLVGPQLSDAPTMLETTHFAAVDAAAEVASDSTNAEAVQLGQLRTGTSFVADLLPARDAQDAKEIGDDAKPLSRFPTKIVRAVDEVLTKLGASGAASVGLIRRVIEEGTNGLPLSKIAAGVDSFAELREQLDAIDLKSGNVTMIQTGGVTRFDTTITQRLAAHGQIDLDGNVFVENPDPPLGDLSLGDFALDAEADYSAELTLHVVLGVDERGFFIDTGSLAGPELTVSNVQVANITSAGRLGFLGVTLDRGSDCL